MKQKILILFLLFAATQAYGQIIGGFDDKPMHYYSPSKQKAIDTCQLQITYTFQFVQDTVKQDRYTDQFALQIGKRVTRFYSLFAERRDSIMYQASIATDVKFDGGVNPTSWMEPNEKELNWEVYTGYPNASILTYRRAVATAKYSYEEPIQMMFWNIKDERKEILGYQCQRATTTFRGRTYDAWFTYEIPISKGPWKFHRLPGLILEVTDRDSYFHFTAIGIEQKTTIAKPIYAMTHQYRNITRDQMLKLERRFYLDPVGLILDNSHADLKINVTTPDGKRHQMKHGSMVAPYIPPLELE